MTERVYTAVIRDGQVLMVRHVHDGRDYWTLPGGRVEAGEDPISAAGREVREETGIAPQDLRELFRDERGICFLGSCEPEARASIGSDPELADGTQWITDVSWFSLEEMRDDWQVSLVLRHIRPGV